MRGIDPATREGRLKILIVILGALLVVAAVAAAAMAATSTPRFCSSCHEMQPQYAAWRESGHAEVSCVACHVGPGAGNLIRHKIGALGQVYGHLTGNYEQPIKLKEELPAANCLTCHQQVREVQQVEGLRVPHDRHLQAGLACTSCHRGLVHEEPPKPAALMQECMTCHQQRGAANECSTCHV